MERMEEALDVRDKTLTEEEEKYLEELYEAKAISGHQWSGKMVLEDNGRVPRYPHVIP